MPPVIVAVGAAAAASAASAATAAALGAALAATTIGSAIVAGAGLVASLATAYVGSKLLGGGSTAAPDISADVGNRFLNIRQPLSPQQAVYGQVRKGGTVVFIPTSGVETDPNVLLHMVIPLAGHEVAEIGTIFFDDEPIELEEVDGFLVPRDGVFFQASNRGQYVRIRKYLGTADQAADPDLIAADVGWTADHRLRGIAYIYCRLGWHPDKFPTGIPTITAVIKGKKVYDPRTGATGWSNNWALCQADYLCDTKFGLSAVYADEIDETALIAAANACDEEVAVTVELVVGESDGQRLTSTYRGERAPRIGDRITLDDAGTYYVSAIEALPKDGDGNPRLRYTVAGSLTAARAGTAISVPAGRYTVRRTHEPRYTCDGVISADKARRDVIDEMRSAAGASVVYAGGKWGLYPAVWRTPDSRAITASDLRGPMRAQTKLSRRDNANGVKGSFVDPSQAWQAVDYPPVPGSAYLALDGGDRNWASLDLPLTTSPSMAQRLAKIALERTRRPISVTLPCKLTAFRYSTMSVVPVTLDNWGFSGKTFEVVSWRLAIEQADGGPALGVDLTLRELDANAFIWTSDEEAVLPSAPATRLPDPRTVAAPGVPTVTESLYETRDSAGVKARATVVWTAPNQSFVAGYQAEYRLITAAAWTVLPPVSRDALSVAIDDIKPGVYDFRVKAFNNLGVSSAYATRRKEIVGLGATPADVTGLSIAIISSLALLEWDAHPDLDVRVGGHLRVRHSPALTGATWDAATDIGRKVDGNATQTILPALSGTYLVKAIDSSGIPSATAAAVTTNAASLLDFSNLDTITESPTFSGTKTDCEVTGSSLALTGNTEFDDIPDLDAVANLDAEGGISATGLYEFASGTDLGAVGTARITAALTAAVVNTVDQIDSRGASIDDWESFDGAIAASAGAYLELRQTDDDPAATPTWGEWHRLTVGDYRARAWEFRLQLYTDDPAYNVEVSSLSVSVDQRV